MGGWVGWVEEDEEVRMRCCGLGLGGWVGGWVGGLGRGGRGGSNEVLWAWIGWVGGWVGGWIDLLEFKGGGRDLHHMKLRLRELLMHEAHGIDVVVVITHPSGHGGFDGEIGPFF